MSLERGVSAALVGLVLSVLLELTGLLSAIHFTVENTHRAVGAAIAFWWPVLSTAAVLFLPLYGVIRLWNDGNEQRREGNSKGFDQMDYPVQDPDTLSTALAQLRSVLDDQLETLSDIDDKAVRTVRVEVILLGAIASAAQITTKSVPVNVWMKIGGVLLLGSIVGGIFTYSVSDGRAGPEPEAVFAILTAHTTTSDVYLQLLEEHREAIADNREILEDNGKYIFYTQLLLVLGILSGGAGVLLAITK